MEVSDVTVTGPLSAQRVAYNPHWARTLGFWNLTDRATFAREFARKRAAVQVFFFFKERLLRQYLYFCTSEASKLSEISERCRAGATSGGPQASYADVC